jgi:dTDP-L-rhamnose 4-epimerase
MSKRILITGGAGFIGSHLADELLEAGYRVRVLDCLTPQVHGPRRNWPDYLARDVELVLGDARDAAAVGRALQDVDAVYHFAAAVGVGQSMYEIAHYTAVNNLGTAVLLEALSKHPVERLVVASSMSIYGEGTYHNALGQPVAVSERGRAQLQAGRWEMLGEDGQPLAPVPTDETKTPVASSVYALSKYDQERLCLIVGGAYGIPTVALRFFNVYGPRQALSNPYTGVLAIFASRCLSGKPPLVFEDGRQQRDFVNVHDVARGCRLALETPDAAGEVFNIGNGRPITVRAIAEQILETLGRDDLAPEITSKYRVGDIRHCFADISKARRVLGYEPQVDFDAGVTELAQWLEGQSFTDRSAHASDELTERGLVV